MRRAASFVSLCMLWGAAAQAATGRPDWGNFVGTDSLAPAPSLPTSYLGLTDTSSATYTAISMSLPGDGDDHAYALPQLDNAVLYGTTLSNCSANHNGFISCGGSSSFFDNQQLPDPRFGGQTLVAPYWDDLTPISGTSKLEVWAKAGAYVIVQWTDFGLYGSPTARLTFRALFDLAAPKGAVLFQYLKMEGANGAGATIGIQRAGATTANQYAFNTAGAVVTGTAGANLALQAVLFGYDSDGDRLSDSLEAALGTDPAKHDTDGGGLDDAAELAAKSDPKQPADDGANADTDGDGITDASERFYGTDPTKKDTDGDSSMTTSLSDSEELYTRHTDPARADTDRDGSSDSAELDAGTDPLDPTSTPPQPNVNLDVSGSTKGFPRSALDANGDLHVVAVADDGSGLFYWMLKADGTVKIPETFLKLPVGGSHKLVRPVVRPFGGKVYITYELLSNDDQTASLGFLRLNPAGAPKDGTAVLGSQVTEVSTTFRPTVGSPRHHDMRVDQNGVHLAYVSYPSRRVKSKTNLGLGYAVLSLDGVTQRILSRPLPNKATGGMHHWSRPSLVLGSDGTAQIFMLGNLKKSQSSLVWTSIGTTATRTYAIPLTAPASSLAVAAMGSRFYLYLTVPNLGIQLLVLDPANVTSTPANNNYWYAQGTIDPSSLLTTGSLIGVGKVNQASLTVLANGMAVGYFQHAHSNDLCIQGFLPDGMPSTAAFCVPGADNYLNRAHGAPNLDLLPLADNTLGLVYNHRGQSGVFFTTVALDRFAFPATAPAINVPPRITSIPPQAALRPGQSYQYQGAATDPETPTQLTWKLDSAPFGMTVSATGLVSWTPQASDLGPCSAGLTVCDASARCVTQRLGLTVVASGIPVIVSVPPSTAVANSGYAYQVATDAPASTIASYTITAPSPAPGDMALSNTGLLTWTPTTANVGSTLVTVTATDTAGQRAQQTFSILVTMPMAIDPVFTSTPATTASVGRSYAYKAVAKDPGDPAATFTYALTSTPSGDMALATDGTLSWKPGKKELGTQAITIQATSSSGRVGTQSFAVTVINDASGGCAVAHGESRGAGLLLLLAALGLLVLRRRVA